MLVVHTAFSRLGPVEDGPRGLIDALQAAVGPEGTLVMPSMSDDDDRPFDPAATPCRAMGIVADTFWRLPDVRRSDSPHAFAARGPRASEITAPHPVEVPHGPDSPIGRASSLDAQVLLIGVGHDANTTVHLAETLAGVRYRIRKYATVLRDGRAVRCDYAEIDHCCQGFDRMDAVARSRSAAAARAGGPRGVAAVPRAGRRGDRPRPPAARRDRVPSRAGRVRGVRRGPGRYASPVKVTAGR